MIDIINKDIKHSIIHDRWGAYGTGDRRFFGKWEKEYYGFGTIGDGSGFGSGIHIEIGYGEDFILQFRYGFENGNGTSRIK
jgi:hypothetical protein